MAKIKLLLTDVLAKVLRNVNIVYVKVILIVIVAMQIFQTVFFKFVLIFSYNVNQFFFSIRADSNSLCITENSPLSVIETEVNDIKGISEKLSYVNRLSLLLVSYL